MSATKIIHSIPSNPFTGDISVPVYQTSTFIQDTSGVNKGFDNARSNNPTQKVLEDVVTKIESGHAGLRPVDALKLFHLYGENIAGISRLFSGSLSYIFNNFTEKDELFSTLLKKAILIGFTEPDPRENYAGMMLVENC